MKPLYKFKVNDAVYSLDKYYKKYGNGKITSLFYDHKLTWEHPSSAAVMFSKHGKLSNTYFISINVNLLRPVKLPLCAQAKQSGKLAP